MPVLLSAVARLRELNTREATTLADLGRIAIDMGQVVLDAAPPDHPSSDDMIGRLARESGISVSTLRTRRLVVHRLGPDTIAHPRFLEAARWATYREIAQVNDATERHRLIELVHTQPAPGGAGWWKRDALLEYMGRPSRHPTPHQLVAAMPAAERLELMQTTLAQPDVQQALGDRGARRALTGAIWSGVRLDQIEPADESVPTVSEIGDVLDELGQQVERLAEQLESPNVIDLLKACQDVGRMRRSATRAKLRRLELAANRAAALLDDVEPQETDVLDVEVHSARPRLTEPG